MKLIARPGVDVKELSGAGGIIKVSRSDKYLVFDVKSGPELSFHGVVTPECWARFKKAIAQMEKMMVKAGWLKPSERGFLLQLVKSE